MNTPLPPEDEQLLARLNKHPQLRGRVDRLIDLVEDAGDDLRKADEAERRVIEEVLYTHPAVAEVAVVGNPDPRHGEIPVAHVALKPGASADAAELRDWCRARLGRHEIPRRVEIRPVLPKNAAGKILKRELRTVGERERGITFGCDQN